MFITTVNTRPAERGDVEGVSAVHSQAWRNAYSGLLPYRALTDMIRRRGKEWWEKAICRSSMVLVIEFDDQIAGYATIGKNRVKTFDQTGEVYELYIKPEFQGLGLGTQLFLDARKELARRGCDGTIVWTLRDNHNANSFYHNAGGQAVAIGNEVFDGKRFSKIAYAWD